MANYYTCDECGWVHDKEETKGYCPRKKKEKPLQKQHERNPEIEKFYHSKRWLDIRSEVLRRDTCCQRCLLLHKLINYQSLQVHHINKIELHWDKRDDVNNLITLCATCHRQVDITCHDGTLDFDWKPKPIKYDIF